MTSPRAALQNLVRDRLGRVTVEQGLIAALVGVVVLSVITTLTGVMEGPPTTAPAGIDASANDQ